MVFDVLVSMGFFDDIFLPSTYLQPDTFFDPQDQIWYWKYQGNQLYMDIDETIRFRVLSEQFNEIPPTQKEQLLSRKAAIEAGELDPNKPITFTPSLKSPYTLTVSGRSILPYLLCVICNIP